MQNLCIKASGSEYNVYKYYKWHSHWAKSQKSHTAPPWNGCDAAWAQTGSAVIIMCLQGSRSRAGQPRCAVETALASAKEVSKRALTILNIFFTIPVTVLSLSLLPFQSSFHSPFLSPMFNLLYCMMKCRWTSEGGFTDNWLKLRDSHKYFTTLTKIPLPKP